MKRFLVTILSALLLASCGNTKKDNNDNKNSEVTQEAKTDEKSLVKNIDYKYFVKNIWDIEKYPDSFAYQAKLPCIIDFYADWCGPCRKVAPIMENIAKEYDGEILVYKVNVDNEQKLPTIFKVKNIPTVFFLPKNGQPMSQVGALSKEEYETIINKHLIN